MKDRLLRVPVIGTALRVQTRYTDDAADNFAASIGFFGFVSLIPLILVALSVVGFVLRDDAELQARIVTAVGDAIPGINEALGGSTLADVVSGIGDRATSFGLIGTATLFYSGLKIVGAAQRALAVIFRMEVPTGIAARAQQVLALVILGPLALAGTAVGGSVGIDLGENPRALAVSLGLTGITFVADLGLFLAAYRFLSPDPGAPPVREILPGALLAATVWVALKAGGAALLVSPGDGSVYGDALAGAVGLLLLLYLAGRIFMYGAVLSAVRSPELGEDVEQPEVEPATPGVSPRPVPDEAPAPADLARLAGAAAVLGIVARAADRR